MVALRRLMCARWAYAVWIDARPEAVLVGALHGQSHVSAAHRTSGAAISFRAVEGQDAAAMACREEMKPVSMR
jgi:hypothetical protein